MQALLEVVLPVFLVLGFGYGVRWRGLFGDAEMEALMRFTQGFAIPCLLFLAIARLDLGQSFQPDLLFTYYAAITAAAAVGLFGARLIFSRPWEDSVAIGFACLFSNSVLLGLPITQRAYGAGALGPNYAIVALHAPFCYTLGFAVMETIRAQGRGLGGAAGSIARAVASNPLMIGIALGFAVNLSGAPIPGVLEDALNMMARAALPAALFGLGGVLYRYRPEGDMATIAFICGVSLLVAPALVWVLGRGLGLAPGPFRSAVITAAMAPGVNTYIFANIYGVARRVVASAVLAGTVLSVLTSWMWLALLP